MAEFAGNVDLDGQVPGRNAGGNLGNFAFHGCGVGRVDGGLVRSGNIGRHRRQGRRQAHLEAGARGDGAGVAQGREVPVAVQRGSGVAQGPKGELGGGHCAVEDDLAQVEAGNHERVPRHTAQSLGRFKGRALEEDPVEALPHLAVGNAHGMGAKVPGNHGEGVSRRGLVDGSNKVRAADGRK